MVRHTVGYLRRGMHRTGTLDCVTGLWGSVVLHGVPVADRKGEGHIVRVGCSSHERRRLLVSRTVQSAGGRVVRRSLGGEEAVEDRADTEIGLGMEVESEEDMVIGIEGRRDMEIEVLVVLGCSRNHGPAGEDEEDEVG